MIFLLSLYYQKSPSNAIIESRHSVFKKIDLTEAHCRIAKMAGTGSPDADGNPMLSLEPPEVHIPLLGYGLGR